jgi:hypothetical protein
MKKLIIISTIAVAAVIGTTLRSQPQGGAGAQDEALFLHLLAPGAFTDPQIPAHRIITARVYPFQDFSISVDDPEGSLTNRWDGGWTNPHWSKNGSPETRPLEPLWNSGDATLAGRIEKVNGKFFAHLQGRNRTTLNYYHGEIELEKPVYEQGGYYRGGTIWGVWFALSANPDCSPFLRALQDGSLKRPNIVDKNNLVRDRWEHGQQNSPHQFPSAEPGGAAPMRVVKGR